MWRNKTVKTNSPAVGSPEWNRLGFNGSTINVKHINPSEQTEFHRIFHCELKPYWHPILGFDVLKFETDLKLDSASLSMAEVIRSRFGADGENLIRSLLIPFQN